MNKTKNFYEKDQFARIVEEKSKFRLIDRLRDSYLVDARKLGHRMAQCGSRDIWTNNTWYCRQPACPRCKRSYADDQAEAVQAMMADAKRSDLSFVTVLFGVAGRASDVQTIWEQGRTALRNRIKAMRRETRNSNDVSRWDDVRLVGWLEADPYDAPQVPLMQGRMQDFLEANGPILFDKEVGWIVHVHLIIHHPRIDWQQVRDALQRQWPEVHAVDVQPFDQPKYSGQTTDIALFATTKYALKYTVGRMLHGESDRAVDVHPASWMAQLHAVLYAWSTGFRSWRVLMRPAGSRAARSLDEGDEDHPHHHVDRSSYSEDDWTGDEEDALFASLL